MHDHALIPDTTKSHHLSHDPSGVRADRAHFVYEYKYGGFTWVLRTTENPLIHRTLYTRPCNTDSRVLHQAQTLHTPSWLTTSFKSAGGDAPVSCAISSRTDGSLA
jgi:hypothetical protein